jgi:hypothetical protein
MQVQRAIPEQAHALVVAILISRVYTLFCDKQGSGFHFYYKKGYYSLPLQLSKNEHVF